jgi:phosphoribosylcarboxyaminoimidazole (NCAIR) mutase
MPGGVAPAVVLEPGNTALLTAKILGLSNPELKARVESAQEANRNLLIQHDEELHRGNP